MPNKVHALTTAAKTNGLRTALTVTLITGLTLVLLSTAVFSLAATTRSLSSDAERLHTADESLRAATTVRAQLALAVHGARVDSRLGTNSSASVQGSVAEAKLALESFQRSTALLEDDNIIVLGDNFAASVAASSGSVLNATPEDERNTLDSELDRSYQELIGALTDERQELLSAVEEADRRMGTLGNLASFVVAFLLPTSAIFIYRQLARRPRRQVELEHELELERRVQQDRTHALRLGLRRFNDRVAAGDSSTIVGEAERFSVATALVYGQHTYDVARVELAASVTEIAAQCSTAERRCDASSDEVWVLIDQGGLRLAIDALIDDAFDRGATRIHLAGRDAPAAGKIDVLADGTPIPQMLIREAFLDPTELTEAGNHQLRGLIFARTLLEGMGARIAYEQYDDHDKFEITLPRAIRRSATTTKRPEQVT